MIAVPVTRNSVLSVLMARRGQWLGPFDMARELGQSEGDPNALSNIIFWFVLMCDQHHKLERQFVEGEGRNACKYRVPPLPPKHEFDPYRDPVP